MSDDPSFFEWAFKGLVTVILTVGGWLWIMMTRSVAKNKDDIAGLRLHVAENYAEKDSLERIHDRIDDIATDIKALLSRTAK